MAQPRIIVAGRIPDAGLEVLRPHGNVWGWKHDEPIEINELYERIAGADAVLTLLTTKVDAAFLDAAGPQLKVVVERRRRIQQHRRRRVPRNVA